MSLLHPTAGEVIDRLSIVRLKIAATERVRGDVMRLTTEAHALAEYLEQFPLSPEIARLSTKLANVNGSLWQSEDDVRVPNASTDHITSAAKCITRLNDLRCQLIRQIDQACGVETIEEKIYG